MKSKITKKLLACVLGLMIVGLAAATVYIAKDRQMLSVEDSQLVAAQPVQNDINKTSNLKIGIIGDSWVAGKKIDQPIQTTLKSSGVNAELLSFGHPGAKSRHIYQNLISDASNEHSSNSLLLDKDVRILVVVAGVNDAAGHIGKDFYAHHMKNIVQTANSYSKLAIVVEVPEFGIEEPAPSIKSEIKHDLYKILFDRGKTDIIADYRHALKSSLDGTQLNYKIIPFDNVSNDYARNIDIYGNPWHLNDKGNELLGSYIGQNLASIINN